MLGVGEFGTVAGLDHVLVCGCGPGDRPDRAEQARQGGGTGGRTLGATRAEGGDQGSETTDATKCCGGEVEGLAWSRHALSVPRHTVRTHLGVQRVAASRCGKGTNIGEVERTVTGKWYEELTPGTVIEHAIRRTITEGDNVAFTTMTMNPAWLHLDHDYAANETEFGQPLVNSMLTVGIVIGISVHETTLGTTVANLGFSEVSFPAPMFHGDTLRVATTVLAARPSKSRPTQGIVTFEHRGYNQHDTLVCRAVRDALMLMRPT